MNEQRAFTKAILDSFAQDILRAPQPDYVLVSPYIKAVFVVTDRSVTEEWDWRRTKRELRRIGLVRKGVRREYHKVH